ncbi:DNA-dependent protein kinase catalytic subunit-like [Penaeus indicus]|uniref:DNA-dependent protein kinase catalytic subunit-like n=1 Tax=Penaeus indicus TaxID=29960 RepID=UPI00300DAB66
MAGGGEEEELELLLGKLVSLGNGSGDHDAARDVIVDITELLAVDLTPAQYDLYISQVLGEKGIITFGRSVSKDQSFVEAKKSTLDVLKTLLDKEAQRINKYVDDIRKYTLYLYNVEKSTKVQAAALDVFCTLLAKCGSHIDVQEINVDHFIERLCIDIRSAKGSTVLQHQLQTLGMLMYIYPQNLRHQSPLILKIFKGQLVKHTGSKPDLSALAGVLRGLALYLHHFPEGIDDDPQLFIELYKHIHKVLNPDLNLPRRDAQRAALELIHTHGAKFSTQLFEDCTQVFQWFVKWCGSRNRDDHKAALPAMDTFIVVIANMLELQAMEDDKKGVPVFKYLLQEYNKMLETSESTSKLSLAVKGYGLLSGACRQLLSPVEVHTMFNQVLTASQHAFYQSGDMLENKLTNLPSYIESLAIIISNMDVVNSGILENVQQLSSALVEHFPLVSTFKRFLAYRALFRLFFTVYNKPGYFHEFLHTFVYKAIVLSCSHAPEVESSPGEQGSSWRSKAAGGEGWKGLKNEVVTFSSYIPLWTALMVPEKVANIKVSGMPATVMTEMSNFIYSEFISCILEISEKLDLTTYKQNELQQVEASGSEEGDPATSDPVSGLKAKVPKDFQVYMNVVSLLEKVLPLQSEDQLEPHIPRLMWFFVTQSSLQPLVSAHYNATTTILICSRQTQFFTRKQDPEVETSIHLLMSYVRELLQSCRQYRDQLLASCLTLILHLPLCIVQEIFPQLVSPLQMALQLGVSYLPLAEVCILALQLWTKSLSQEILSEHMPHVLPLLLPYLRSQETGGEAEVHTRVITVKMAFARQRRKVDQKKIKESKRVEETAMQKIQLMILRLIGGLDPLLRLHTIPKDPDTIASAAVRWNIQKLVKFATPFEHIKIDIHLDDLLPHVVDLAVNSSDRQTKVAASELLHSIIILMIGTGAQKSQETQLKEPMAPLYRHIFSAMLRLACDPDHVTRQLFLTLSYQTIHWFTNNRNFENVDTMVLLEALMEGIVTANDPALRDVSAQCLAEFVKWSRKQCRQQNSVSSNIKSIIKRIFSFCKHPSAFKRLGGALAWNSIYREIREDGQAVDIWTLDLLAHLMTSLDLAQADDPALGTHEQTKSAINHIERIIRVKSDLFQKKSGQRRLPPGFGDGSLVDVLKWLFEQCGRPKALVRHTCMELLASLAPQVKGCASVRDFIDKHVGISKLSEIVDILEGGGEAKMGISYVKNPTASSKHIGSSLKDIPTASSKHIGSSLKDINIFLEVRLEFDSSSKHIGSSLKDINIFLEIGV